MPIRNHKGELLSFRYSPSYMADCLEEYTNYRTDIRLPFPIPLFQHQSGWWPTQYFRHPGKRWSSVTGSFPKTRNGIGKHWKKSFQNCWMPELSSSNPCPLTSLGMPMEWCGFCLKILSWSIKPLSNADWSSASPKSLRELGFAVVEFPYFYSGGISAVGSYLNYLETPKHIFLPVFGISTDADALKEASGLFRKDIVPVLLSAIPKKGGALNCISWEDGIDW